MKDEETVIDGHHGARDQVIPPGLHRTRSGPRRSEAARAAVLRAADDLLVDVGYQPMTMSGIAKRAGVAKQTIYRWWRSKADILLDVLAEDLPDAVTWPADDIGAAAALEQYLARVNAVFTHSPSGQVLFALIGCAQQDPATAAALRRDVLCARRTHDVARLRATGPDPLTHEAAGQVLDLTVGALFHSAVMTGTPIDPQFLTRLASTALARAGTASPLPLERAPRCSADNAPCTPPPCDRSPASPPGWPGSL